MIQGSHLIAIGIAFLLSSLPAMSRASVWPIQSAEWTTSDEAEYATWVERVTAGPPEKLFEDSGTLAALGSNPMDCADFAYGLRILYASKNGLPFQSKAGVSAASSRWDHISSERRLSAFLKDAFSALSTRTLVNDTEPVPSLSRRHVRGGTILLAAPEIGHAWVIRKVRDTGIPELIFGSVPAQTEVFLRDGLPRGEAVYGKVKSIKGSSAGLRRWISGGNEINATSVSLKVLRPQEWRPAVFRALEIRPEPLIESIGRELGNLCRDATVRAKLVRDAAALRTRGCLRGKDQYNYSTTNRDSRLKEGFLDLWEVWMTANDFVDEQRRSSQGLPLRLQKVLDDINQVFSNRILNSDVEDVVCPVEIQPGAPISLRDIRDATINSRLSVDPNESILARWGLEPEVGGCN
ncbi:MAG: hypothetical protein JNJ49_17150 [Bdellovibrionaceae bacterium]|nr:hypothetical protein [Pseudobdellovibrionaceae bacterium]